MNGSSERQPGHPRAEVACDPATRGVVANAHNATGFAHALRVVGEGFFIAKHVIAHDTGAFRLEAVEQAENLVSLFQFDDIDDDARVVGRAEDKDSGLLHGGFYVMSG